MRNNLLCLFDNDLRVELDADYNCELIAYSVHEMVEYQGFEISVTYEWRPTGVQNKFTFILPKDPDMNYSFILKRITHKVNRTIVNGDLVK